MQEQALVFIDNEQVQTTSEIVALYFGKQHKHVLRDIRDLLSQVDDEFAQSNFGLCSKVNDLANKKPLPYYKISRDGFMLLVMGYTGEKAMQLKLAYIKAFNKMYEALQTRHNSLQAQYNKAWLEYELASAKASEAGRALSILGKKIKPACRQHLEYIHRQIQPNLELVS